MALIAAVAEEQIGGQMVPLNLAAVAAAVAAAAVSSAKTAAEAVVGETVYSMQQLVGAECWRVAVPVGKATLVVAAVAAAVVAAVAAAVVAVADASVAVAVVVNTVVFWGKTAAARVRSEGRPLALARRVALAAVELVQKAWPN